MTQSFSADCVALLQQRHNRGAISRRQMIAGLAALGLAPAAARAATDDLVLANSGGPAVRAMQDSFGALYHQRTGGRMVIDGSGTGAARMRAMVEANSVIWDVCDAGMAVMSELGPRKLLQPIDYGIVDKSRVISDFTYPYGVCGYLFSTVLVWNKAMVSGTPTIADVFDLKKIPGKRMMKKDAVGTMELALLADGVPPDRLYPLDQKRALAKIAAIKDQTLFWNTGSQSEDWIRSGEAAIGFIWNTRAGEVTAGAGNQIGWTFQGGLLQIGTWVVPKGNPAGPQRAMQAIALMQDPDAQISLFRALGNGPANPEAASRIPADLRATDPGAPENAAVQAKIDAAWYLDGDHYSDAQQQFLDMLAS